MNPLKKQKKIMKTKNMLWAALSMTAALVMTACSNNDNTVETPAAPQAEVKTIPYSVTVGQGGDAAATRATVDEDMMTLRFAAGDKLYVFDGSSVVKGVLTLKSGDEGKSSGATFEGSLSYTGDEPADDLELNAVLVGSKSKLSTITDDRFSAGAYPTTSYCDDVATAVEEWSWLAGTGTYGEKSFTLSQSTTFLNFEITFEDGTKSGTKLTAVVKQNSTTTFCTADVTTKTEDGKVVAKFVLPLDDGYKLDGATVTMGDKEAISFGGDNQKLLGKVYNVKRTYAAASLITSPAVGQVIGNDGKNYANATAATSAGTTAVAKIVYVGSDNGEAAPYNHGLALALSDASTGCNWSTSTGSTVHTYNPSSDSFASESGLQYNATQNSDTYPAFKAAIANNGTAAPTGCSSWFLPSAGQWDKMATAAGSYANLKTNADLQDASYWSSTESDASRAWYFYSGDGDWGYDNKDNAYRVRACLAF